MPTGRGVALALLSALAPAAGARGAASTEVGAAGRDTLVVRLTDSLRYEPGRVKIKAGDTVEWENASVLVHTVTDDPSKATLAGSAALPAGARPFDSGPLQPAARFIHTFEVPGEYHYFCIPHEGAKMRGVVVVAAR